MNKKMINDNIKDKKGPARTCFRGGFTLLEALVAISILMVAVVAPITIAQKGLSSAVYSKNQMTASYLAQDAIEYVKNKRDEISLKNNYSWDKLWSDKEVGLVDCVAPKSCQIDTIDGGVTAFVEDSPNSFLRIGEGNLENFYQYENGTPTNFSREITIKQNPHSNNDNEALVTATVRWGGENNEITVSTLIYNF